MKTQIADGTEGCLIWTGDQFVFRVYFEKDGFKDYEIFHSDLNVVIKDADSMFYEDDSNLYLDHHKNTLGVNYD